MLRDILLRNDELNDSLKSYWVYRHVEATLATQAKGDKRRMETRFSLGNHLGDRRGTVYTSVQTVIALGLGAHAALSNVSKKSLIYLDARDGSDESALLSLTYSPGRADAASTLITLGGRAKTAASFFCPGRSKHHELPPLDLAPVSEGRPSELRLTVINHLEDETLARSIVTNFVDRSDFVIDCYGLKQRDQHNRIRHLSDGEISGAGGCVHVHVGWHEESSERLRVCDSWQSHVPVLLVAAPTAGERMSGAIDIQPDHNALLCDSYEDVCGYLGLLLECSALRRLLLANGRNASAQSFDSWRTIVRELAS